MLTIISIKSTKIFLVVTLEGFFLLYFILLGSRKFGSIHFVKSHPKISFMQILEAREELLQSSPSKKKPGSEGPGGSLEDRSVPSTQAEGRELSPSSVQNKSGMSEAPSFQEPTPDPMPGVEADKHPVSITEAEIIDKSVIEEELVVKNEIKSIAAEKSKFYTAEDDKEVEEWLEDMAPVPVSKTGNITSVGQEEDVSFSDLEDDEDY